MRLIFAILLTLNILNASELSSVEKLGIEYEGYKLGAVFTNKKANKIEDKSINYNKYLVNSKTIVVTDKKENRIVVIRKRFNKLAKSKLKSLVSSLIYQNGEPTAVAHEKIVYWIYDNNGKKYTQEDILKFKDEISNKQFLSSLLKGTSKSFKPFIMIKLQSSINIFDKNDTKKANVDIIYSFAKYLKEHGK